MRNQSYYPKKMNLASLADHPLCDLAEKIRRIPYGVRPSLDPSIMHAFTKPVRSPQNLIFFLRPARKTEMRSLLHDYLRGDGKAVAEELANIVKDALPREIANFRFFRDEQDPERLFLMNDMGEKSDSRPSDYFVTDSRFTLRKRVLNLGNFSWRGSDAMIPPFIAFNCAHQNP